MIYLVATVHVIISIFLILVVLLQRGSGADLSVFGGGGTQAAFGARSAASVLHKMTVWGFVAFIVTTISYNFLAGGKQQESVLSGAATAAESAVEGSTVPEATAAAGATANDAVEQPAAQPIAEPETEVAEPVTADEDGPTE